MKALWREGSRLLILDEPTSMLTPQGYEELRRVLVNLKREGLAVILITHKLHEAIELGDRVTVLRAGRVVGSLAPGDLRGRSEAELSARIVEMMFGEEAAELADAVEVEATPCGAWLPRRELGEVALASLRGLALDGDEDAVGLRDVTVEVRAGEIVGVAGVDGNGQRELAELIAGQRSPRAGEVLLFGEDVTRLGVAERERRGLRYITDDRIGEGMVADLDVATNAVLKRIGRPAVLARRHRAARRDRPLRRGPGRALQRAHPDVHTRLATLSGGNVQKLLLARELAGEPRVVVFNKPTHGLDVRTAEFVRDQIREAAAAGLAALVISTEIEELVDLCDRIVVISRGELTGEVENTPGVEERVGALMVARGGGTAVTARAARLGEATLTAAVPILLALVAIGHPDRRAGARPVQLLRDMFDRGLIQWEGFQESIIRSAPLLLIAAGLIVAFRANLWNLGGDGQFLLGAAFTAGLGPPLLESLGVWPMLLITMAVAALVGGAWTIIPAYLRGRYGVNEIITTLMMSFIGIGVANVLVKGPFKTEVLGVARTDVIPFDERFPLLFDTRIHLGFAIAVAAILGVHVLMTRTSLGLRLRVLGANPRAALHAGPAPGAVDGDRVRDQRRPDRALGIGRDPRRPGLVSGRLQPRLRAAGDPARVPRAAERDRLAGARDRLLGDPDRRRVRGARGRDHQRHPLRARRSDAAVHGGDRVPARPPGARDAVRAAGGRRAPAPALGRGRRAGGRAAAGGRGGGGAMSAGQTRSCVRRRSVLCSARSSSPR